MTAKVAKTSGRGSKPGERRGGRAKGTPNKLTAEKVAAIEASGLTPLDYMLSILRDEKRADQERFAAAKEAAPFCHPRLAAVDANLTGKIAVGIVQYPGLDDDDAA